MAMRNPYNYSKPQKPIVPLAPAPKPQVMSNTAYHQNKSADYLAQKINSARPEELTLMLYEGLVKFIKQGQLFIDNKDVENSHRVITRAQAIIAELSETLDMSFDVSKGLSALYDYIAEKLVDANIKKDKAYLDEALPICEEIRDTWKEAMKNMR
jgi:flagellar protein FliS